MKNQLFEDLKVVETVSNLIDIADAIDEMLDPDEYDPCIPDLDLLLDDADLDEIFLQREEDPEILALQREIAQLQETLGEVTDQMEDTIILQNHRIKDLETQVNNLLSHLHHKDERIDELYTELNAEQVVNEMVENMLTLELIAKKDEIAFLRRTVIDLCGVRW